MLKLPRFFLPCLNLATAGTLAAGDPPPAPASSAWPASAPAPIERQETEKAGAPDLETLSIEGLGGESEMEQDLERGLTFFRRGVVVRFRQMELVANQIALAEGTGDLIADGQVRLKNEGVYWTGEHLEYNYQTGQFRGENFRAGLQSIYAEGLTMQGTVDDSTYSAGRAFLTTDDVKKPGFRIRARSFKLLGGTRLIARNATLYLGGTPVFALPAYQRDLRKHQAYWVLTPGYRSAFGPYLLNSYHFPLATNLLGGVRADLYQRRGIGLGPEFEWNSPVYGEGHYQFYYLSDQKPRPDPFGQPIRSSRHRISFSHRVNLRTNLTAKVVVRQQSDAYFVRDFFETEYRQNTQPTSFLELNQSWSNWSLNFFARPQANEFFQTVERLPDVRLSGLRQQIGESPLFYESESSAAYLRFEPGALPPGQPALDEYGAMRADSYHQVVLPQNYFGWLNFVPRVGGRFTQYSETEGNNATFDARGRFVFNTGAETSMKASQVWRGARSKFWDLNELRHIVEPSLNYVFVPEPNHTPQELPQFDREIPSLRLLPIEYPDYNAVDSIDAQNVVRLSLRNRVQTKREGGVQNLVNWGLYTDWRLDPRQNQTTFSDIYSDLDLRPRSWLSLSSENRFQIETGQLNGTYHSATLTPDPDWSWRVGHRYFRGEPAFGPDSDNNTFFSSLYLKMNENWAARLTHHFEARDGTLEEQYYTLYRDFRSWTTALTLRLRDDRSGTSDFSIALTFQLKAFPRFRLNQDANDHSFLLGS